MNHMVTCPKCKHEFADELKCLRCHHKWKPRTDEKPEVCPKCKSPYWFKPRIRKKKKGGNKNGKN